MRENKEMLKLKDEALEEVSGGVHYYEAPYYCIYCKQTQLMKINNATSITYKRKKYNNCKQYYCDSVTRFFYLVTDPEGPQFYLSDRMEEVHI